MARRKRKHKKKGRRGGVRGGVSRSRTELLKSGGVAGRVYSKFSKKLSKIM